MWRMLQVDKPDTFVLATNRTETVREFVQLSFKAVGINIAFSGINQEEIATDLESGKVVMKINPEFYRPAEVDLLIGNAQKAKNILGWEPQTSLEALCEMMVEADMKRNTQGFSF
jgi:GDPmannose 4,6-dehydratase